MSPTLTINLVNALCETLYMVMISGIFSGVLGGLLGIALFLTRAKGLTPHTWVYRYLSLIVNMTRSIPFIILLIFVLPFTRFLVGTSIGTHAAVVPLTIGAVPLFARLVETIFSELNKGLTEAGLAIGATPLQIVRCILFPEALPGLVQAWTLTLINLVGYSAMAGTVGAGGLGDLAIRYGYQRFDLTVMLATVTILIVLVQLLQSGAQYCVYRLTRYRR